MTDRIVLKGQSKLLMPVITEIMAIHQLLENLDIQGGNSRSEIDLGRRFRPKIKLFFKQDTDFVAGTNQPKGRGQNRKVGELTFRLMNESTETITEGELTRIGQRVKEIFGANNGYVWNKGKELYCYADWEKGYQLQILARSQAQAQDITTKILSIQGHTPIWKYMTKSENLVESERYPNIPQVKTILGKQVTLPLTRANVEVRFRHAEARINPLLQPIVIYDRTGKKVGALVR